MARSLPCPAAMIALLLTAGCAAQQDDYPTLAIRDGERARGTLATTPAPVATPVAVPPSLAPLLAEARASHEAFSQAQPAAQSRAERARGAAPGSDAWALAEVALADLASHRSRTMITLADLDRLYLEAITNGPVAPELVLAREEAERFAAQEDAALAQLLAMVGR